VDEREGKRGGWLTISRKYCNTQCIGLGDYLLFKASEEGL